MADESCTHVTVPFSTLPASRRSLHKLQKYLGNVFDMGSRVNIRARVDVKGGPRLYGFLIEDGHIEAASITRPGAFPVDVRGADHSSLETVAMLGPRILNQRLRRTMYSFVWEGPDRVDIIDVGPHFASEIAEGVGVRDHPCATKMDVVCW